MADINGNGQPWTTAYRALLALAVSIILTMVGAMYAQNGRTLEAIGNEVRQIGKDVATLTGDMRLRAMKDEEHDRRIRDLERPRNWRSDVQP